MRFDSKKCVLLGCVLGLYLALNFIKIGVPWFGSVLLTFYIVFLSLFHPILYPYTIIPLAYFSVRNFILTLILFTRFSPMLFSLACTLEIFRIMGLDVKPGDLNKIAQIIEFWDDPLKAIIIIHLALYPFIIYLIALKLGVLRRVRARLLPYLDFEEFYSLH